MEPQQRIVTQLPLQEVWDDRGLIPAQRQRPLSSDAIRELLRTEAFSFVVADIGHALRWIPRDEQFGFWKSEVQPHLAEPGARIDLDPFPGAYCYVASAWQGSDGSRLVVLEKHH